MEKKEVRGATGNNVIVLFPFMAQGHLNPFLDLARHLASRTTTTSITITVVSTTANVLSLRPRFLSYPTINFTDLPPFHHKTENTDTLSSLSAISTFYHASESLQPSFHNLISQITESNNGRPPICIISDMFLGFAVDVAHSFGSRHVPLYTSGPYAMSIYNSIWTHLPHRLTAGDGDDNDDDDIITLPDLPPEIKISRTQLSDNMIKAAISYQEKPQSQSPTFAARQAEYCKKSDGSLWNTVEIIEKSSLDFWKKSSGKPVWAIGPLLPISSKELERGGKEPGLSPLKCIEWLNQYPSKSVLYVSFGSQNSIPVDQMIEFAKGLEESEKFFIWVFRNPTGFDINDEFRSEWLPEGFEDRICKENGRGLFVKNWAPQIEILSHESVGGFLTHCGWNSVLESLSRGVPMIGWPLGSEQFYNSKLLEEELGVCIELGRGFGAKIKSEEVAEKVRIVLGEGEKGKKMRRKVEDLGKEMKKAVSMEEEGSSSRALDDFVQTLIKWSEDVNN